MEKLHFIGIGGIGMSGLAEIYLSKGCMVTGSDLSSNNLTAELAKKGASIFTGHTSSNIEDDVSFVVRSSCIKDDNPEVIAARNIGVPVIYRGELLKKLMEEADTSLGVTGTHGKTTTSALMAHIYEICGEDPTVVVGGEIELFNSNAKPGNSNLVIAEVDESDGYFRNMGTTSAVITNIEREHMENYGSFDNLLSAYEEFIRRITPGGKLVYNGEDKHLPSMVESLTMPTLSFGFGDEFDATCKEEVYSKFIEFDFIFKGKNYGRVRSPLIGRYNLMNILGALAICTSEGLEFSKVSKAVTSFIGAKRRFDLIGKVGTIEVREDYAHHPTELKAVIDAAQEYAQGRIIAVFQPHRFSRTKDLLDEFSDCFNGADILIITDIYSAHEEIDERIGIEDLFQRLDSSKFESVAYIKKEEISDSIARIANEDDMVLVLGAGDIKNISLDIVDKIKDQKKL